MNKYIKTLLLISIIAITTLSLSCEAEKITEIKTITKTERVYREYSPTTKAQLIALIEMEIERQNDGYWGAFDKPNLNHIDTSRITDMSNLFKGKRYFRGIISEWDVSNVTNMQSMFERAENFDDSIANWDVSKVTNMQSMFKSVSNDYFYPQKKIEAWGKKLAKNVNLTDMFVYTKNQLPTWCPPNPCRPTSK